METTVVRYTTTPDEADNNQQLVEQVFKELSAADGGGLHYAAFRLADGVSFLHIAVQDGTDNPLADVAAFREFQSGVAGRCTTPPTPDQAELIGSYRFGM